MSTRSDLAREILPSNPFVKKIEGLGPFFKPQNIAVIGATEKAGSVGRTIVRNLIEQPVRRDRLPRQPEAAARPGDQGPSRASGTCPTRSIWPSWPRPRRRCRT